MKIRYLSAIATLVLASLGTTPAHADTTPAPQEVKNVVLVHGLFADGSSWGKVIRLLQAKGLHVTAVQNPTTSLDNDVAAVKRALAQQNGPVILVAHSYGGMVISQAGDEPEVKGLVYIAARAPEAGEDYPALTKKYPAAPASAGLKWNDDGYGALSESAFVHDFAGDLPTSEAEAYYAVQQPIGKAITTAKTTVAAWHNKPTWYAVSTEDRTINPDLERFMAKRHLIFNAKRVIIYGVGGSASVGLDFEHKLLRLGIISHAYSDVHLMLMVASQLDENDVVIAISQTGVTRETLDAVNTARAHKAKIVCITNDNGSPLSQSSDLSIFSPAMNGPLLGQNAVARIVQLNLLDSLFIAILLEDYQGNKEKLAWGINIVSPLHGRGTVE